MTLLYRIIFRVFIITMLLAVQPLSVLAIEFDLPKDFGIRMNNHPLEWFRLFGLTRSFWLESEQKAMDLKPFRDPAWLGISMAAPKGKVRVLESGESLPAVEVRQVFPESVAETMGLRKGDRIFRLDGKTVSQNSEQNALLDFRNKIREKNPGDTISLEFLRGNEVVERSAELRSRPKAQSILKPHSDLINFRESHPVSLLTQSLRSGNLGAEWVHMVRGFRGVNEDVVSSWVGGGKKNPFRLQEINHVMQNPLDLPVVARNLTESLHASFAENQKDLRRLLKTAFEALDLKFKPVVSPSQTIQDLAGYLNRILIAIGKANKERESVLAVLDTKEKDILQFDSLALLKEDLENPQSQTENKSNDLEGKEYFDAVLKLDLEKLLNAAAVIALALDPETLSGLVASGASLDRFEDGWIVKEADSLLTLDTPVGKVLVGGPGRNVYREDAVLILDLGGDDIYLGRTGASSRSIPFSVVIDLKGDDLYESREDVAQGSGFMGGGFLLDVEGDDHYLAKDYSQGSGLLGLGILIDLAGNDHYQSGSSAQGAGVFGIGLVLEGGGSDRYTGPRYVQGFGFVKGFGAIVDAQGNDHYFAGAKYPDDREPGKAYQSLSQGFGYGIRPWESLIGTSGGIGILADSQGNDHYIADYFAQGSSYWHALGILSDKAGHDRYLAGRYSQGAGVHLSAGVLWDDSGNDQYIADFGVSQGCGHDYATGILIDNGGDDRYVSGVIAQGAGNMNGLGILNDNSGNDQYIIENLGHGRGNYEKGRDAGSFGFLFDTGGGKDRYSSDARNNDRRIQTQWGVLVDLP